MVTDNEPGENQASRTAYLHISQRGSVGKEVTRTVPHLRLGLPGNRLSFPTGFGKKPDKRLTGLREKNPNPDPVT